MRARVILFSILLTVFLPLLGEPALAGCHEFWVADANGDGGRESALSVPVTEGKTVTLTVMRDAAANPSSVQVTTVNGTAKAPTDYTSFNQRVSFTSETEKEITIPTRDDNIPETGETFSVRVSDAQGCPVNTNFEYHEPARVTIRDNDAATPKPKTPAPAATSTPRFVPATTSTPSPSPSPTPTAKPEKTDEPEESPTPTVTALAVTEEGDDGFPWLPVAAVAGFLAAGAGALMLTRMRGGI